MFKKQQDERPSLPWLQATKNNRKLVVVIMVLCATIAIESLVIVSMFPLKEKIPIIIEFQSGGNNFVMLEKASGKIQGNMALVARFLRMYVKNRETVDKITERFRYPNVHAYSSSKVAKNFQMIYGNKETGLFYKKGFKRDIIIRRDSVITKGVHQVEFESYDSYNWKKEEKKNEWVAIIEYEFYDQKVSYDERLINPIGLIVTEYTLSRRKK